MLKIFDNNIEITRGDNAKLDISIFDAHGKKYEMSENDTLTLTVKKFLDQEVPDIVLNTNGNSFSIVPEHTKILEFGRYHYDVQLTMANGEIHTIIPNHYFIIASEVG